MRAETAKFEDGCRRNVTLQWGRPPMRAETQEKEPGR